MASVNKKRTEILTAFDPQTVPILLLLLQMGIWEEEPLGKVIWTSFAEITEPCRFKINGKGWGVQLASSGGASCMGASLAPPTPFPPPRPIPGVQFSACTWSASEISNSTEVNRWVVLVWPEQAGAPCRRQETGSAFDGVCPGPQTEPGLWLTYYAVALGSIKL